MSSIDKLLTAHERRVLKFGSGDSLAAVQEKVSNLTAEYEDMVKNRPAVAPVVRQKVAKVAGHPMPLATAVNYTVSQYIHLVESQGRDYQEKDSDLELILKMVLWMLGFEGEEFEAGPIHVKPWNPAKSLYLWGPVGTGKSTLAKAAFKLKTRIIAEYFQEEYAQYRSMETIFTNVEADQSLKSIPALRRGALWLDDIDIKHFSARIYGENKEVLSRIIYERFDRWENAKLQTVMTSNASPDDIYRHLEEKGRSRFLFQYITVHVGGESRRKN